MKKKYGLIGYPIEHSLSPKIHNYILSNKGTYKNIDKDNKYSLIDKVNFVKIEMDGINVTSPYKERVIDYLDEIDDFSKKIGSINTIKNNKGKLIGYNTDIMGFKKTLEDEDLFGQNILILGAGGAAKAIIAALFSKKVDSVYLYNRTYENAFKMKDIFRNIIIVEDLREIENDVNYIFNCTTVGMNEYKSPINIKEYNFKNCKLVYDLIYSPIETKLLKDAKELNINIKNGLDMLIYQALYSEAIWFNKDIKDYEKYINRLKEII